MKQLNDTKTAILDEAQDMVQRQSISGVSFQELANRVGIKKGSMYYHFESKDDLTVAILQRAISDLNSSFRRGEGKSPTKQLNYFFEIYSKFIEPGKRLCPGGASACEWGKLSTPVRGQISGLIEAQIKGLTKIIASGIKSGEFNSHGEEPKKLASWVTSSIQGALLTSRVFEDSKMFEQTAEIVISYLTK